MMRAVIPILFLVPLIAAAEDVDSGRREPVVRTIVIDPGHGGRDNGTVGAGGTLEKNITLAIAKNLSSLFTADDYLRRMGVRVVLTRRDDRQLALEERAAIANSVDGDLFISIHVNSNPVRSAYGPETYILHLKASDEHARKVAEIENQNFAEPDSGLEENDDLKLILFDVIHEKYMWESMFLAERIQNEFNATLRLGDRGVKQAPFRVLKGVAMPAVLVEVDFLSNPRQEQRLRSGSYQTEIAQSIFRAVKQYIALKERGYASLSTREPARSNSP